MYVALRPTLLRGWKHQQLKQQPPPTPSTTTTTSTWMTTTTKTNRFLSSIPSSLKLTPHPLMILQGMQPWIRHPTQTMIRSYRTITTSASVSSSASNYATTRYYQLVAIWTKNISRLYARHILTIAAASVAVQMYKVQLEQAMTNHMTTMTTIDKPSNWQNWSKEDWEERAMSSLGTTRLERLWMATSRVVSLLVLMTPLSILVPLSYVSTTAKDMAWEYALWGIEQAGPTWIKLVQWATTRQDLFSPEFCQYFGKLRDDTEGHSWEETHRILQHELGTLASLVELDPTPIGSGCIAQVYQGTLREGTTLFPPNTKVAVKVQHPGIWHKVCVDFYILHKIAKWIEAIPRLNLQYLSLSDTVRQFRDIMLPQLDLTLEAKHLERFNRDFANDKHVTFPKPIQEFTTSQVLIETFIDGTPIMNYTAAPAHERELLARIGLQTTLKMIFLNDFLHGDLHPGNILVSGTYPNMQLHLLDCGIVLEMGPDQHVNLVKVLGAFTRRNGRLAGQLMVDLKSETQAGPDDVELFVRGIVQICEMDRNQVRVSRSVPLSLSL